MVANASLTPLIDTYIAWLVAWHRVTQANGLQRKELLSTIDPSPAFSLWREQAFAELAEDQPAIEKLVAQHEQLHTFARMVVLKTPDADRISLQDDESVISKYADFMQALRRFEMAFAAAASGLDPLTGLRSRTGLQQEVERELTRYARTGRSFCVAIMDLDHFKMINDTYGHDAGDRVLASVANHVSRDLRTHDDAFRFGGEEFLLCLKETDLEIGFQVLERLRLRLADKPVALSNGKDIKVTASFGLAVCEPTSTPAELLKRADAALYRAKKEGRNRIVVADAARLIEAKA